MPTKRVVVGLAGRDPGEYMTLDQLVERVPWLSRRWVRAMVADGRLPTRKVPGSNRLLFHESDLSNLRAEGYGAD